MFYYFRHYYSDSKGVGLEKNEGKAVCISHTVGFGLGFGSEKSKNYSLKLSFIKK